MSVRLHLLPLMRDLRDGAGQARGAALEQERADQVLETLWRQRVANNIRRRIAVGHYSARQP